MPINALTPALEGYEWSESVLRDVLTEKGLPPSKATAVLEKAATGYDDGNRYLKRSELEAAASAIQASPASGYRWSASVLADVMTAYGITDAAALIRAAVERDDGNGYLARSELTAAAEALKSPPLTGYRWSPSTLADVMTGNGIADEQALLRAAIELDDGNRYLKRSELEAAAKVLTGGAPEIGIISDIDKTILPDHPGDNRPDHSFPGAPALFQEIEIKDGGKLGDTYYVTARGADGIDGIPEWLADRGLPPGPIDTGVGSAPWVAQAEKVRDIQKVLDQRPDQRFILFGDTNHRDPDVYREVMAQNPGRVIAGFVRNAKDIPPERLAGLHLFAEYTEVAATLLKLGVLDEPAARRVMVAAQLDGLDITDAQIDELIRNA